MAEKKRRRGRPPNEIPSALLEARVPAPLVERLRDEAAQADQRLGKFLAQTLEQALEERNDQSIWERARAALAQVEAELGEVSKSKDADSVEIMRLKAQIEVCKQVLGITEDDAEVSEGNGEVTPDLEGVLALLLPVIEHLVSLVGVYRDEDKLPDIGWKMVETIIDRWSAQLEDLHKQRRELRRAQRQPGYHRRRD